MPGAIDIRSVTRATLVPWTYAIGILFAVAIAATPPAGVDLDPLRFWTIVASGVALSYIAWVFWGSAETAARFSIARYGGDERYEQAARRWFAWAEPVSMCCGIAAGVLVFRVLPGRFTPLLGMALACAAVTVWLAKYAHVVLAVGDGSPVAAAPPVDRRLRAPILSVRALGIPRKAVPLIVATGVILLLSAAAVFLWAPTGPVGWLGLVLIALTSLPIRWNEEFWTIALLRLENADSAPPDVYPKARAAEKVLDRCAQLLFAGGWVCYVTLGLLHFSARIAVCAMLLSVLIVIMKPAYLLSRFGNHE